jgi:hypothetical protein
MFFLSHLQGVTLTGYLVSYIAAGLGDAVATR